MKKIILIPFLAVLSSCGSSTGTSAGGSGSTGAIQIPAPTCGTSSCMATSFAPFASSELSRAITLYDEFNDTIVPTINSYLTTLNNGLSSNSIKSCADLPASLSATNLDATYVASIATTTVTVPSGLTVAGNQTVKKLLVSKSGTEFAEVDFYCGSGTSIDPETVHIILKESATQKAEVWYEKNDLQKRILLAADWDSKKMLIWFKSESDGISFDLKIASNLETGATSWDFFQGAHLAASPTLYSIRAIDSVGVTHNICYDGATEGETAGLCGGISLGANPATLSSGTWAQTGANTVSIPTPTLP